MLAARKLLPLELERQPCDSSLVPVIRTVPSPEVMAPLASSDPSGFERRGDVAFLQVQAQQRHLGIEVARLHRECHARIAEGAADFGGQRAAAAHLRQLRHPPRQRREVTKLEAGLAAQGRIALAHRDVQRAFEDTLVDERAVQPRLPGVARQVRLEREVAVRDAQCILAAALRERAAWRS